MDNFYLTTLCEEDMYVINGGSVAGWIIVGCFCVSPMAGVISLGLYNGYHSV